MDKRIFDSIQVTIGELPFDDVTCIRASVWVLVGSVPWIHEHDVFYQGTLKEEDRSKFEWSARYGLWNKLSNLRNKVEYFDMENAEEYGKH